MKKLMTLLLAALMILTVTSAMAAGLTGGWATAEDPSLTEERVTVFDRGMANLVGVNYIPVAYLGSQVVAGTNHCFLCQGTVVAPDTQPAWYLVYLYEALDGNVTVLSIVEFDFGSMCIY